MYSKKITSYVSSSESSLPSLGILTISGNFSSSLHKKFSNKQSSYTIAQLFHQNICHIPPPPRSMISRPKLRIPRAIFRNYSLVSPKIPCKKVFNTLKIMQVPLFKDSYSKGRALLPPENQRMSIIPFPVCQQFQISIWPPAYKHVRNEATKIQIIFSQFFSSGQKTEERKAFVCVR